MVGTWSIAAGQMTSGYGNLCPTTDTLNDYIEFDFEGNACVAMCPRHKGAGKVSAWVDGGAVLANVDLYVAQSNLGPYCLWLWAPETAAGTNIALGYGRHRVRLQYVANNGSIETQTNPRHRLQVYSAFGVDLR